MTFSLDQLDARIANRAAASPDESYTAKLLKIWECRCGAACCTGTMLKAKTRARPRRKKR